MDAIRSYLESMFARLPDTDAVRKAKAELQQMMEDKYTELRSEGKSENEAVGTVIAEFGNLDELADSLGIGGIVHSGEEQKERRMLTLQQVKDFLSDAGKAAHCTALGVLFCIACVVPVIVLYAFADAGYTSEVIANAVGVPLLFVFVAAAVALFILSGQRMREWKFLDTELCGLEVSGAEYVQNQRKAYLPTYNISLTVGVVLCIVCAVPVIIAGSLDLRNMSFWEDVMSSLIFVLVGLGVFLIVSASKKKSSFSKLLGLNDATTVSGSYTKKEERSYTNRTVAIIMSVFWPLVVCAYFILSFVTHRWQYTWLIFVIAGVVSMLIKALYAPSDESEKTYSSADKEPSKYTSKTVATVMSVFWPTVTCAYLIWSFLSFDWYITWIVWPVAAVASTLMKNIYGADE